MKILVTGSQGHLGTMLNQSLSVKHDVIGLDMVTGEMTDIVADLSTIDPGHLPDVDLIMHTAGLHAPHVGKCSDSEFVDTNIHGTLRLLEHACQNKAKRFVLTSSTSAFGDALVSNGVTWVDESLTPKPRDIYDITKIAAEQLCLDFHRRYGLPVTCIRVGRFWNEPLPDRFFYRLYRGLDVRDAVQAHVHCLKPDIPAAGTYIVSAQSPFTKADLPELEKDPWLVIDRTVPELKVKFKKEGWSLPSIIDRVYDITKAKKELGYLPKYNIASMLKD